MLLSNKIQLKLTSLRKHCISYKFTGMEWNGLGFLFIPACWIIKLCTTKNPLLEKSFLEKQTDYFTQYYFLPRGCMLGAWSAFHNSSLPKCSHTSLCIQINHHAKCSWLGFSCLPSFLSFFLRDKLDLTFISKRWNVRIESWKMTYQPVWKSQNWRGKRAV